MKDLSEINAAGLCADLDAAGQRRLWLVQLLLERCGDSNPMAALELASRFEHFISRSAEATLETAGGVTTPTPMDAASSTIHPDAGPATCAADNPVRLTRGRTPLLDQNARERFVSVALTGADNRDLAREFQLTVRQAHAVRLSLARQNPQVKVGLKSTHGAKPPSNLSRAEELTLQEEFLQRRPAPKQTIDDVIRYVRQRGDTVVCQNGRYLVNGRSLLSASELVSRANRYREGRGDPPFKLEPSVDCGPEHGHSLYKPNGTANECGSEAEKLRPA
jgi:hypothetical protein